MLRPMFPFDLSAQFVPLQEIVVSAVGGTTLDLSVVPKGINRVYFQMAVQHNDAAGAHNLSIKQINPQASASFALPCTPSNCALQVPAALMVPIIVPSDWHIAFEADAMGAGSVLLGRALYLDYVVK